MKRILKYEKFLLEYVDYTPVANILPKKKFKHSKRVAELTKLIKDDVDIYSAAVYHDFLERGGDTPEMEKILSPHALELVKSLTNVDETDTLTQLKNKLIGLSSNTINDILIIKLCDRADNLKKRSMKNEISKKYLVKSVELIQWIYDTYKGDKSKLRNFIEGDIIPFIPKLSDKILL